MRIADLTAEERDLICQKYPRCDNGCPVCCTIHTEYSTYFECIYELAQKEISIKPCIKKERK